MLHLCKKPDILSKNYFKKEIFLAQVKLNETKTCVIIKRIEKDFNKNQELIIHLKSSGEIPKDILFYKDYLEEGRENIIKFLCFYEEEDFIYIVLEKAEFDLNEYCKDEKHPYNKETRLKHFLEIIRAVFYLHANNCAHMDISLNNILLVQQKTISKNLPHATKNEKKVFNARLADFGESRTNIVDSTIELTKKDKKTKVSNYLKSILPQIIYNNQKRKHNSI